MVLESNERESETVIAIEPILERNVHLVFGLGCSKVG